MKGGGGGGGGGGGNKNNREFANNVSHALQTQHN